MTQRDRIRLTDAELRDYLASARAIIINSIGGDGVPHPMPMFYAVEPDAAIRIRNIEILGRDRLG